MDGLASLLSPEGLTPHGFCLFWQRDLMWLHISSDGLTAFAYYAIPFTLAWLARRRRDVQYLWVAWLFVAFICACATAHVMAIVTLWVPLYWAEGLLKAVMAVLSMATAAVLWRVVPILLALPSPAERDRLHAELQARVTEAERVGRLLQDNELRLRLAQEAGELGSWEWDLAAGTVLWSPPTFDLFGQPRQDAPISRARWQDWVDPADRAGVLAALEDAAMLGGDYDAEFRVVLPDGGRRWLAERGRVVVGPSGPPRMLGVTLDVTERRRAEDALAGENMALAARVARESHAGRLAAAELRAVFEHAPDAMFVVRVDRPAVGGPAATPGFVYLSFNPATERLTGESPAAMAGRRLEDVVPADRVAQQRDAYVRCARTGEEVTFVTRRPVGSAERDFETSLAPVRDPDTGEVRRIVGVARDVTQRQRLEQQLRQVLRLEVTGRLAAGFAHDFNNLLQALMGGLEMLQLAAELPPEAVEYAEVAVRAARRGAELTHRLLAFSRQQVLHPRPVSMAGAIEDAARVARTGADPAVAVRVERHGPDAEVMADAAELEAALQNLIDNAAESMPAGGVLSLIGEVLTPPDTLGLRMGRYARIEVRDTGAGMAANVAAQACEPFFTTKGQNGLGLGLSMVQGFARQSGGELVVASEVGVGTKVALWLPLAEGDAAGEADPPVSLPRGVAVLLVDDAADVLATTGAFLRDAGAQVTQAADADQALAALRGGAACDVLVTDFALPGCDGAAVIEAARSLRPHVPALVITGFAATLGLSALPGVEVLRKPFGRRPLLERVAALAASRGLDTAAALAEP